MAQRDLLSLTCTRIFQLSPSLQRMRCYANGVWLFNSALLMNTSAFAYSANQVCFIFWTTPLSAKYLEVYVF